MPKITSFTGKEILDSRGVPTIEVTCVLASGVSAKASVPSGKSTGSHEACELRDGDTSRYAGQGVLKAIYNIESLIGSEVVGKEYDQRSFDDCLIRLDGTEQKTHLGANAMLGASLSFARASAEEASVPLYRYLGGLVGNTAFALPQPMFNIINGGKHADSGLDIQEFLIAPSNFSTCKAKVEAAQKIVALLGDLLMQKRYSTALGDEGGFAPKLTGNEEALELIETSIKESGFDLSAVRLALDVAGTSFYHNGLYHLRIGGNERDLTRDELIAWYKDLVDAHSIISIEDPLYEEDFEGFAEMRRVLGDDVQIVGDDLTTTNMKRINEAIEKKSISCVLIKPNQIGTLTEAIDAIELAKKNGLKTFVSHRSGETHDTFIADLAVGLSCDFIKAGSVSKEERMVKYNRLIEIEGELGVGA